MSASSAKLAVENIRQERARLEKDLLLRCGLTEKEKLAIQQRMLLLWGTLRKRGWWNPSWKKRLFELSESSCSLTYYKLSNSTGGRKQAKGIIQIRPNTIIRCKGSDGEALLIEIVSSTRTFVLEVESREQQQQWFNALRRVQVLSRSVHS
jgi:hypothetical protein